MAHQVYWIKEPQLLALEYTGRVTPDDLRSATTQALEHVRQRQMDFLIDLSQTETEGAQLIKASSEVSSFVALIRHPNARWFAMVGPNVVARFAIQMFFRQAQVKIFATRDEAVAFLFALRQTDAALRD